MLDGGHQRFADTGKLLHMLVPVNVVGRAFPDRFKRVKLALDHDARGHPVKAAQHRLAHRTCQGHTMPCRARKRAGPVQVQADVNLSAHGLQQRGIAGPSWRQHHDAGRADAAGAGQRGNAL